MKKSFITCSLKPKKYPLHEIKEKNKNTNQIIAFTVSFASVSLITDISVHIAP